MGSLRLFSPRFVHPTRSNLPRSQHLRSFTSAQRLKLKEDKERSPEEADRVKEEQRRKAEAGKGEWHEELASQSESAVAAERNSSESPEELQKKTAKEVQKNHPDAK